MSQPDDTRESVYLGISPTGNLVYLSRKRERFIDNYKTFRLFVGRRITSDSYRVNRLEIREGGIVGFGGKAIIYTKAEQTLNMTETPVIWRYEQLHNLHLPNYVITEYEHYAVITESTPS